MLENRDNTFLYLIITSLYILTFICLIIGALGYTTIAVLIFSIILISGSILGFVKKAITFLPSKSSGITNYYGDKDMIMHIFGYFMNGLTLFFGIYLLYSIFISNLSWSQ